MEIVVRRSLFVALLRAAFCLSPGGCGEDVPAGSDPLGTDAAASGVLMCGANVCRPYSIPLIPDSKFYPCCAESGKCGAVLGVALFSKCVELNAPGDGSDQCRSLAGLDGCCRPDGTCGVLVPPPIGCIGPENLVGPGNFADASNPATCKPAP